MDGRTDRRAGTGTTGWKHATKSNQDTQITTTYGACIARWRFYFFLDICVGGIAGKLGGGGCLCLDTYRKPLFYSVTLALVYLQRHVWLFERAN